MPGLVTTPAVLAYSAHDMYSSTLEAAVSSRQSTQLNGLRARLEAVFGPSNDGWYTSHWSRLLTWLVELFDPPKVHYTGLVVIINEEAIQKASKLGEAFA